MNGRTVATAICGIGATAAAIAVVAIVPRSERPSRVVETTLRLWGRAWLAPAGVRLKVTGTVLEEGVAYVVVSNHQSNLDPIVHVVALRRPLRILAMRELFAVPLLGWAMRRVGMVEVDRRNPDTPAIDRSVHAALASGASLLVYPEGGTSGDGSVQRFHSGAFRFAIENAVPLVPMATIGTRNVWPTDRNVIRRGTVRVLVGEPISTGDLTQADVERLTDEVRTWIAARYEAVRGERA